MTKTVHSACACGCEQRTRSAAARYLPGHAPKTVPAKDATGLWVQVKLGEEDPAFAHCTSVREPDTLFVTLALADHPTCGHAHLDLPRNTLLRVQPA